MYKILKGVTAFKIANRIKWIVTVMYYIFFCFTFYWITFGHLNVISVSREVKEKDGFVFIVRDTEQIQILMCYFILNFSPN